jgi:hypothetical protein
MIDILLSTITPPLPEAETRDFKSAAFRAILAEEKPRLMHVQPLFDEIEREMTAMLAESPNPA